ncbi:MAG: hypothetical protein H8E38_09435 [SAR324 cluster bacterium]|nr:hypothetical protein [SAR324 cluster bacterium]MBL7035745.1 hypothetical protein [SAR324 cluster bacterium]
MSEKSKNPKVPWKRLKGTTNFYPTYVDGNLDKVTPAAATHGTQFQTVIPRYNLSMSETRNAGTGPTFLETEYQPKTTTSEPKQQIAKPVQKTTKSPQKTPKHNKKKIRTDFWE